MFCIEQNNSFGAFSVAFDQRMLSRQVWSGPLPFIQLWRLVEAWSFADVRNGRKVDAQIHAGLPAGSGRQTLWNDAPGRLLAALGRTLPFT